MNAPTVRRIRLPADHSSPGLAREAIRTIAHERDLSGILDEALLLVTELTTNSVVHAGTEVDVEITAADTSLTVTVLDFQPGTVVPNIPTAGGANLDERGRGLLLVDQLASSWGTLHFDGGKGVWFRLDVPGAAGPPSPTPPGFEIPLAPAPDALGALGWSGTGTSLTEVAEELLQRLVGVIGAAGAALTLDEGDGPHTIAAVGRLTGSVDSGRRVPLRVTKPWRAELLVAGGGGNPYARPLTSLAADRLMLLVENHRLRRADSERRTWLTFLADASELLAQSLDVELTLALIPRLVVPRLGTWCAIHAADAGGELRLAAAAHADESMLTGLLDALGQAAPQLKEAMSTDAVVPLGPPLEGYVVALIARGQHLGTLTVGGGGDTWQRSEEVAVVEDVARRAALAIDNANIHAERRSIAQALQRSLLPPQLPKAEGVEFGAEYVPTGEGVDVGGDFYDVVPLSGRRWLVVVGDVSGKGVQAATVTGLVRDVTRVLVRDGRPLPETLKRINETLLERGAGRFCTLCLAEILRRQDGTLDVALHLAGHDQPVLLRADGRTELAGQCGTALGLLDTINTPRTQITLAPGDTLIFYTDGVTERRRGPELFGVDRLRREAGQLAGFPADVVAARLRATTLNFSQEPPRDDIAIFAVRNDH
ncbi:ATP-binding SpoIIE family protein phosphatase [Dactylosporangium aurantiacum]|uniref:ATP-binding SpoIIE family protein phosphatase n=1 Tax=Dactylosporangium aurantiacum TaxID=35754 RepID=UPI001FE0C38D|nr:ATP-binding SpoIIE family protein phosphatase [Dactylosporangium aurantiacum]MDG6101116.1 SpoIIE family protein phosphatase [Dactylosporangium aurantiacum]